MNFAPRKLSTSKFLRVESYQNFQKKIQSIWVKKNAFLTTKITKTGTSVKLEWKFMNLAIFCWVGLVQASTLDHTIIIHNIENSGITWCFQNKCHKLPWLSSSNKPRSRWSIRSNNVNRNFIRKFLCCNGTKIDAKYKTANIKYYKKYTKWFTSMEFHWR